MEKLNHQNYTKWSRLMFIAIGGKDRLNHITDDPIPTYDPQYAQQDRQDLMVTSWILENIEPDLVNQFLDCPSARYLWKGIKSLYNSGREKLQ